MCDCFSCHGFFCFDTELVQDFRSWLTDLNLYLKEHCNQSGDAAVLAAKLHRLKVLHSVVSIILVLYLRYKIYNCLKYNKCVYICTVSVKSLNSHAVTTTFTGVSRGGIRGGEAAISGF